MDIEAVGGQGIDPIKEAVTAPCLIRLIQENLHGKNSVSLLDFGSGDSSFLEHLVSRLSSLGINFPLVAAVDRDLRVFPLSLMTIATLGQNGWLVEPDRLRQFGPSLTTYENQFDVANAHMVFQLIGSDSELSLLLCRLLLSLKNTGVLYITDFTPEYLRHLQEVEPAKFRASTASDQNVMAGEYFFDSSRSNLIYCRYNRLLSSMLFTLGFDVLPIAYPSLDQIIHVKPRYARLHEQAVPMFRILVAAKNPHRFISYTEGNVQKVTSLANSDYIAVEFQDRNEIKIPRIQDWHRINRSDAMVLLEVELIEQKRCLNMWIIPEDRAKSLWSRILLVTID
jgi:hypothetical protein